MVTDVIGGVITDVLNIIEVILDSGETKVGTFVMEPFFGRSVFFRVYHTTISRSLADVSTF